jgi:2',3'-cyclic-nucleotide 2'-phosphodiesterase (5'-nucleotidase family)
MIERRMIASPPRPPALDRWRALAVLAVLAGCAGRAAPPRKPGEVTISLVATTDLHGRLESLPWLAGHLANLRAARPGRVLLVDSGDMFQGTLESNLGEGAAVVRAYNALGYAAAAIGNHEYDFGPVGPAHIPERPDQDPRGALRQRAVEANFPLLAANVVEVGTRTALPWTNVRPWTLVRVGGLPIGIVGVVSSDVPRSTHPRNFVGLEGLPLVPTITTAAREARQAGAMVVIVVAHAGGRCARFDAPEDLSSCDSGEEIFAVARGLPPGLVDAIAAGHTHQGVAHRVAGLPIVQAFAGGRAFARVDLTVDLARGRVVATQIFPPHGLCGDHTRSVPSFAPDACRPPPYEGRPVAFDRAIAAVMAPDIARARDQRERPLGIVLDGPLHRERLAESPLGNLVADLLRAAEPRADVAFINGGSLRADLPAGPLRYGRLYEALPFDDALATVRLDAGKLRRILERNLTGPAGILSLSGVRASAVCEGSVLTVKVTDAAGQELPADRPLLAVTNGYLASGGDGLLQGIASGDEAGSTPLREVLAGILSARGGQLRSSDPALYDPRRPRLAFPEPRPVRCPGN